jgi:CubicO group peptidase (beta-lactamase class C family)
MRSLMILLLKLTGALLLLALIAAVAVFLSEPLYWKRLFTLPRGDAHKAVEWYTPTDPVAGRERAVPSAAPGDSRLPPATVAELEAYGTETDSVGLLVYQGGEIVYEKYWPGYARDTRVETASMHKTVLGLAIGAAIADGKIGSVDERIGRHLPEWSSDPRGEITVGQLLQQASGLEVQPFSLNPFGTSMRVYFGTDLTRTVLGIPLAEQPGTRFEYTNINAQVLGLVLERATGRRYAEYLGERVWSRIGAPEATVWLDRTGGLARTYCCLLTTTRAWLQVGRVLLGRGQVDGERIVPEAWIDAMLTPSATNPNYGYQVWLGLPPGNERPYNSFSKAVARHSAPFAAEDVAFLDGWGGQRAYVVPSHELVIVRVGRPQLDWDDARLVNAVLAGLNEAAPTGPAELSSVAPDAPPAGE